MGKQWKQWQTLFWEGSKITADGDCSHEIKRRLLLGRKAMTNIDSILKKQRHYFSKKGPSGQRCSFSTSHVWMWELDHKEVLMLKNWCFWAVVLEKTLESPLNCKEIQPVHPKGNQSWILIGRMDAKAETPILWPPDGKNWLFRKDPNAGQDWRWRRRGWQRMRWLDGITNSMDMSCARFGSCWWWTRSLVFCSPWDCKVGHDLVTEQQLYTCITY